MTRPRRIPAKTILRVENLRVLDDRKHMAVDGVSLEVRAGEILGVAGVQGNGQTELAEALTGLRRVAEGRVTILGHDTTHATPRQIVEVGTAHVPEDRHKHGLVLSFPVRDNLVLCTYYRSPFAKGVELDFPVIEKQAEELVDMFDIRTPSIRHERRVAVRRQPAKGDCGARAVAAGQAAHRQPADARAGRGQHRVHSPAHRRGARQGRGGAADQRGTGRDHEPVRSHRGDVQGPHPRHARRRDGDARAVGPADGGCGKGGRACLAQLRHDRTTSEARSCACWIGLSMPALALVTAFVLGALVIWITSGSFETVFEAYGGLVRGAFFKQRGLSESLVATVPYILLSLAVAVGFKAGLFNIGVEGQFYIGAISAALVRASVPRAAGDHSPAAGVAGGRARRGDLGRHPRLPQGPHGRARSHQHDDDELRRVPLDRVPGQRAVEGPAGDGRADAACLAAAELWTFADIPARLQDPLNALAVALVMAFLG